MSTSAERHLHACRAWSKEGYGPSGSCAAPTPPVLRYTSQGNDGSKKPCASPRKSEMASVSTNLGRDRAYLPLSGSNTPPAPGSVRPYTKLMFSRIVASLRAAAAALAAVALAWFLSMTCKWCAVPRRPPR